MRYDETWRDIMKHEETWWDMKRHDETWRDMMRHDETWWDMKRHNETRDIMRHEETWWDIMRHEETWWDMMRHEETWWDMKRHDDTWWDMMRHEERIRPRLCPRVYLACARAALFSFTDKARWNTCSVQACTAHLRPPIHSLAPLTSPPLLSPLTRHGCFSSMNEASFFSLPVSPCAFPRHFLPINPKCLLLTSVFP